MNANPPSDDGPESGRWKFDMHIHSRYSGDCLTGPETIVRLFRDRGILPLVCDHNSTAGSVEVYRGIRSRDPDIPEIVAEEVMTSAGEIIGLFLNGEVPAYRSPDETLDIIRGQGGLALVPHPFCTYRSSALRSEALKAVAGRVDIIEGYNARNVNDDENRLAREFAGRHRIPVSVGSDAHTPVELGRCWMELDPFDSPAALVKSLKGGRVHFRPMHPAIHGVTKVIRVVKKTGLL